MDDYLIIAKMIRLAIDNFGADSEEIKRIKQLFYDCLHKAKNIYSEFISTKAISDRIAGKKNTPDHFNGRFKVFDAGVEKTKLGESPEEVAKFFKNANKIIWVTPEENELLREFQKADKDWITYKEYVSVTGRLNKRNGRFWKNAVPDINEEAQKLFLYQ